MLRTLEPFSMTLICMFMNSKFSITVTVIVFLLYVIHKLQVMFVLLLCIFLLISNNYWRYFCFPTFFVIFFHHSILVFFLFTTVIVRGLPSSASWQDLKVSKCSYWKITNYRYSNHQHSTYNFNIWFQDHMRKAGDVCFAEVSRDSEGTHCF